MNNPYTDKRIVPPADGVERTAEPNGHATTSGSEVTDDREVRVSA